MITPNEESRTQNLTLPLFNLSCSGDARTVERLLKHTPCVLEVYANPATELLLSKMLATGRQKTHKVVSRA